MTRQNAQSLNSTSRFAIVLSIIGSALFPLGVPIFILLGLYCKVRVGRAVKVAGGMHAIDLEIQPIAQSALKKAGLAWCLPVIILLIWAGVLAFLFSGDVQF